MMPPEALQQRAPPAFPLTILTGFLGAGKTSLLNRLMRAPALADALVLINEFGEIGLDHLFVETLDGDRIVVTSGCLCCTIRGDLATSLEDLLRRRDNGRITPFTRIIIETTGLADPVPVLHTLIYHPYLKLRFRLDGVVTVIDAINGEAMLDRHAEAVKQVAVADRLVLTKTDLLDPAQDATAPLRARLSALNPTARQVDAARGEATFDTLFDIGLYDPECKSVDVREWLNAEALFDDHALHAHSHGSNAQGTHAHDAHKHDINRHDAKICAFALRHAEPVPPAAFDMFIEMLRTAYGAHLLRVKGIVALADDPARPLVIHGVQHMFHPPIRLDAWPDDDCATRIVFVLYDMNSGIIDALWKGLAGVLAPDTPDRAALIDNPLRPMRGGLLT